MFRDKETTAWQTHYQVISKILEDNYGKRIPVTKLAYPFKNEKRKQMLRYGARIDEYRRKNPWIEVKNKRKFINGIKHSFYMLHTPDDELDLLPLPINDA